MTHGFIEDDFDNLVKKVDNYTAIVMTFIIGCCMFFMLRAI
jgi:hypothetical protein